MSKPESSRPSDARRLLSTQRVVANNSRADAHPASGESHRSMDRMIRRCKPVQKGDAVNSPRYHSNSGSDSLFYRMLIRVHRTG